MGNDDPAKRTKGMYEAFCKAHKPKNVFKRVGKIASTKFTICHSAKDVIYDCKAFIERNADAMSGALNKLMGTACTPKIS